MEQFTNEAEVAEMLAKLQEEGVVFEEAAPEPLPQNKFVFGVHVSKTKELAQMSKDIRNFMDVIGEAEFEVHVSVNAKLAEFEDKVMGFTHDAVGFVGPSSDDDDDYYDEEEMRRRR